MQSLTISQIARRLKAPRATVDYIFRAVLKEQPESVVGKTGLYSEDQVLRVAEQYRRIKARNALKVPR